MIEIERPKIECEEISDSYGRFVVEPLERGFGTTLGNSLRRVLLSSLPGVAASAIRIDGVLHEFTTIEGVREDVTEIVLNIKELCVKLHSEGPKKVTISAHGECEVKAGDITADSDVEIMNPDLHIASLGPNGKLEMEIILEHGRGYVSADKNKRPDMPIGQIAVDSIFTPIRKVNFRVENTRVGQITDYDKLTLEIWTDETIRPDEAVSLAAKILTEHLYLFINLTEHAVVGDGGHVLDHLDLEACGLKSADSGFTSRAGSLYIDFDSLQAMLHSCLRCGLSSGLSSERSRFSYLYCSLLLVI